MLVKKKYIVYTTKTNVWKVYTMTYELYLVTNKVNGKRYVGQTQSNIGYESRWRDHWQEALRGEGHQCVFHSAIKGYGVDAFEVKRIIHNIPECDIDRLEVLWIDKLHTFYIDGHGYNMTRGGQGVHGFRHTEETKQKISNTLKCRPSYWTPELIEQVERKKRDSGYYEKRRQSQWRENISKGQKEYYKTHSGTFHGKTHTNETRKKISDCRVGQTASEQTKLNMVLQRGTPVAMLDTSTGEVLQIFGALSLAQKYLLSIGATTSRYATDTLRSACRIGKVAYGYNWKFLTSVTTNPDECRGVEDEMSTSPKRATINE